MFRLSLNIESPAVWGGVSRINYDTDGLPKPRDDVETAKKCRIQYKPSTKVSISHQKHHSPYLCGTSEKYISSGQKLQAGDIGYNMSIIYVNNIILVSGHPCHQHHQAPMLPPCLHAPVLPPYFHIAGHWCAGQWWWGTSYLISFTIMLLFMALLILFFVGIYMIVRKTMLCLLSKTMGTTLKRRPTRKVMPR